MTDVLPMGDEFAAVYLRQLQALAQEISVAISAISGNVLSTLEDSVAKQEMLCANIAMMESEVCRELRAPTPELLTSELDHALALKIRASSKAIRALNLEYASLLKHSGRSIAVLSSLCKSHTGQSQEVRGARLKHQTWSCEM